MPNTNMATFGTRLYTKLTSSWITGEKHKAETGAPSATNYQGQRDFTRSIVQRTLGQQSDLEQFLDENANILAGIDYQGNMYQSGVTAAKQVVVQFALTSANILAMFGAPVTIYPAPAAGYVIQVDQVAIEFAPGGTNYTSGGAISVQYTGGSAVHSSTIPAATFQSGTKSMNILPPVTAVLQAPAATGLTITNATGAFATGNGTAVIWIWGSLIQLQ